MKDLGWHNEPDTFVAACEGVADIKLIQQSPAVLIYGFYDLNEVQKKLVRACLDLKPMAAFVPFEDQRAFGFVEPIIEWFKAEGFTDATPTGKSAGTPMDARAKPLDELCGQLFSGDASGNGEGGRPGTEKAGGENSAIEHRSKKTAETATKNIEDSLTVISAPGEVREVREIARFIAREVLERGTPIWPVSYTHLTLPTN